MVNGMKGAFEEATGGLKLLLILACTALIIAGLKASSGLFVPILLAFFIATVSMPITNWLRKHRLPRWLAVLLTVMVDFAFLAGLVVVAVALVGDLNEKWSGTGPSDPESYRNLIEMKIGDAAEVIAAELEKRGVKDAEKGVNEYFYQRSIEQLNQIDFGQVWSRNSLGQHFW